MDLDKGRSKELENSLEMHTIETHVEIDRLEEEIAAVKSWREQIWKGDAAVMYELMAVFKHRGEANHGHYFLDRRWRPEQEQWLRLDDERISVIGVQETLDNSTDASPYMLAYVRKTAAAMTCGAESPGDEAMKRRSTRHDAGAAEEDEMQAKRSRKSRKALIGATNTDATLAASYKTLRAANSANDAAFQEKNTITDEAKMVFNTMRLPSHWKTLPHEKIMEDGQKFQAALAEICRPFLTQAVESREVCKDKAPTSDQKFQISTPDGGKARPAPCGSTSHVLEPGREETA